MNQADLQLMSEHYRNIRTAVYEEATRPISSDPTTHAQNKAVLRKTVERVSNDAVLNNYRGTDKNTANALWRHLWTINRYAGIRTQIATNEVRDIESIFDDYAIFYGSDWDIEAAGNRVMQCGQQVRAFLDRTGDFAGKQTIGNIPKMVKIVNVARRLKEFLDTKRASTPVLKFVTGNHDEDDVWAIHAHLMEVGYRSDLTALHFLMTIGFQVIKPDIVISKLFLDWGWSHKIIPDLPGDVTFEDFQGKGKYGGRYKYTNERMYKPVINLGREIAAFTRKDDLQQDIGWVTNNPLREFDVFLVKYGQKPEKESGIARTLYEVASTDKKSMKPRPATICHR